MNEHALSPSMRGIPDSARVHTPPGKLLAFLQRERLYNAGEDFPRFSTGEPARPETDVRLPIYAAAPCDTHGNAMQETRPPCPDCGGQIEYAEYGYVPGTRQCRDCEALFADSRYSAFIDRYAPPPP